MSPKGHPAGPHIVLEVPARDAGSAHAVIAEEILERKKRPVVDRVNGHVLFRFSKTYLDRLLLAFPYAQLSPAIDKHLVERERVEFEKIPVPDIEVPGLYDYRAEEPADLKNFQKIAVERAEQYLFNESGVRADEYLQQAFFDESANENSFIFSLDMGLGKSFLYLSLLVRHRLFPALLITPNSGRWSTEVILQRFFDDDFTYVVCDGVRAAREAQLRQEYDLYIVNTEMIRCDRKYDRSTRTWNEKYSYPELFFDDDGERRVWDYIVVDEFHRCKNPDAQVTKGFLQLRAEKWIFGSGTPIINRIEDAWPVLHKIDPQRFPTHYQFTRDICIFDSFGNIVGYKPDEIAKLKAFLAERSFRRRTDHVLKDRPKPVPITREIELTTEQRKLYDQIKEELVLLLEDGSKKRIMNVLTQMGRLKEACFSPELYGGSKQSAKIAEIKNDVEQLVAAGHKAIIFSQWSRATRILERELKQYNPAYVDGSVVGRKRQDEVDRFNEDEECKLYIGTIGANKEAITLSAATYVLFSDLPWTPADVSQAAARSAAGGLRGAHLGKDQNVYIIKYHAKDTIEDKIEGILQRKQMLSDALIEVDGGMRIPKLTVKDMRELLSA